MRVRWSKQALDQFQVAHDFIAADNRASAPEFVQALDSLVALLAMFPGIGVQTSRPSVRMFPLIRYRYLIFYRVRRDELQILRVRHSSRKRLK